MTAVELSAQEREIVERAQRGHYERALDLCREFPQTCAGSGGMGGEGSPCGAHLDTAREVHPDVMPEFIDQVRDDLRRLW